MVILFIDTSSNLEIKVGLRIEKREDFIHQKIGAKKAQVVLPLVEKLLKKNNLKPSDINEIEVNTGPGSFTGIRVGISIANALAYALNIPLNRKKVGQFELPHYE